MKFIFKATMFRNNKNTIERMEFFELKENSVIFDIDSNINAGYYRHKRVDARSSKSQFYSESLADCYKWVNDVYEERLSRLYGVIAGIKERQLKLRDKMGEKMEKMGDKK